MNCHRALARRACLLDGIEVRQIDYPPGLEQPTHYHSWTSVTLVLHGGLEERVGGAVENAAPLSVVVKPAGTEHADRIGPSWTRTLQIALRPDFLEAADGEESPFHAWRWLHAGVAARYFLRVLARFRGSGTDPLGMEAAVFDFLGSLTPDDRRPPPGAPPRWLVPVAEEIDECFASGLQVRALARKAGVHPVSLTRQFRRHFGTTVSERIRLRRIQAAVGLLSRPETTLPDVAYSTGFADQSHLCRVFKAATGMTPGAFRALAAD